MLDIMFGVNILQRDLVIIKIHTMVGRKEKLKFLARATVGTSLYVSLRSFVSACVRFCFHLSKRPSSYCLIHFGGSSGAARRRKKTFDGKRPLMMEDHL